MKKGELEQQSFVNMIRSLAERKDVPNGVKHLLNYLSNYSNVPRKKQKYLVSTLAIQTETVLINENYLQNFIRNSFNGSIKVQDAEKVWDLIEKYKPTVKKNVNSQTEQKRRLDLSIEFLENVTLKKKKKVGGEKWSDPEETKVERFDSLEDVVNKNVSIRTLIAENVKLKKTIHVKELESEFAKRFLPYLDDEHSVDVGEIFKKKLKNLKNVKVENNLVSCNK